MHWTGLRLCVFIAMLLIHVTPVLELTLVLLKGLTLLVDFSQQGTEFELDFFLSMRKFYNVSLVQGLTAVVRQISFKCAHSSLKVCCFQGALLNGLSLNM